MAEVNIRWGVREGTAEGIPAVSVQTGRGKGQGRFESLAEQPTLFTEHAESSRGLYDSRNIAEFFNAATLVDRNVRQGRSHKVAVCRCRS
jgi:hypothetical protein